MVYPLIYIILCANKNGRKEGRKRGRKEGRRKML
jgi:hypothetical protein